MNAPFDHRPSEADEAVLARLEACGAIRVSRRLDLDALVGPPPRDGGTAGARVVGVADVETTGVGPTDRVIELAVRRLRVDGEGAIVEIGRRYDWLEDPGAPLPARIVELTRLRDEDLAGRRIDDAVAVAVLGSCEVVVCHNAGFDAPRIVERLPALVGQPFACTLKEVDWRARGHGGLSLKCLLCAARLFDPDAHRAVADVDATIALLGRRDAHGRTALAELLETAATPTLRFSAVGAGFAAKDALKARGYRWDPVGRTWSREVPFADGGDEEAWLRDEVYIPRLGPKADGPHVETVDWSNRHA